MRPHHRIEILARTPPDKLSKDGIARWKKSSKTFRDQYLKDHPTSEYKRIRVNTPSERISKDPNNAAVKQTTEETLKAMGFKAKTKMKDTGAHFLAFLSARNREPYAKKGTDVALKVLNKFKGAERAEIKDDAKAIIRDPRKKPSQILNSKASRSLLVGVIGIGVCAAMLGTGLVTPSFVSFAGIKALDYGIDRVRATLAATSIDEFLIAATIGNFINSKDAGGFFENLKDSFKKSFGVFNPKDEESDEDREPETEDDEAEQSDIGPDSEKGEDETDGNDRDDSNGAGSGDASSGKKDDAGPEEPVDTNVALQRPSPQRIEAVKSVFEKAGVEVSITPRQTEPGQLQRPVQVEVESGDSAAVRKAVREAGLVSVKTMKPFNPNEIGSGSSFRAYLTK